MTDFVFSPPERSSVAVIGSEARFPLRRVFCVGRNYAAHAREMGKDPDREPPFFFMKPADAVVPATGRVPYPPQTNDLHHEVELVAAIGKPGRNVPAERALDLVWGYGVGIDLTRRDLQAIAKEMARPWEWAKGFDASAPCGPIHPVAAIGHPAKGRIWLTVNGTTRQDGDLSEMIWPVADVVSIVSRSMALMPGDLVYTGTPSGVGALNPGDRVTAGVAGLADIALTIGERA
jgi:fumarylpyruvate hydrolase